MKHLGWFQIAFLSDFALGEDSILPVQVGDLRLMAIRRGSQVEVYDGICPHRGASLAHGGKLEGNFVICPFHGYAVSLTPGSGHQFCARRHVACTIGDLVFVHLGDLEPLNLPNNLSSLFASHRFVPGFALSAKVPHQLVIENAFDGAHFAPVHHARAVPVEAGKTADGLFIGETTLTIPSSRWQRSPDLDGLIRVPLKISAFGAAVVVSHVGGANPYSVITSATPQADGITLIRLSLAFIRSDLETGNDADCYMIEQSRRGLDLDCAIWEKMDSASVPQFVESDKAVKAFRDYTQIFLGADA